MIIVWRGLVNNGLKRIPLSFNIRDANPDKNTGLNSKNSSRRSGDCWLGCELDSAVSCGAEEELGSLFITSAPLSLRSFPPSCSTRRGLTDPTLSPY